MNIFFLIFLLTALIMLGTLYMTDRTGARPNGNRILGITLPLSKLKEPEVLAEVRTYQRATRLFHLAFLLLLIPFYWISAYVSFSIMYLTLWSVGLFLGNSKVVAASTRRLYAIKQEKGWWPGAPQLVRVDTQVTQLKNTFPIPLRRFIAPGLLALLPFPILAFAYKVDLSLPFLYWSSGAFTVLTSLFLYWMTCRERTVTYSEDSEVNVALNRAYKREWSLCWLTMAYTGAGANLLALGLGLHKEQPVGVFVGISIAAGLVCTGSILYRYERVRQVRNRLLAASAGPLYGDDDQYWLTGNYNNPNDSRTTVEKRIGYGTTVNMAKTAGKVTNVILALVVAGCFAMGLFFIPMDLGKPEVAISPQAISIKAPFGSHRFAPQEMRSVTLLDTFPKAYKVMGSDGPKAFYGKFRVDGYGQSQVFIRRDVSPTIAIETTEGWVFLNGEDKEETLALYEELSALLK